MEEIVLSLDMKGIYFEEIPCSMNFVICKMKFEFIRPNIFESKILKSY
jgi:hypothetical protein